MYFIVKCKYNKCKKLYKNDLSYCCGDCHMKSGNGKLSCDCGNDIKIFEWCWKKENTQSNILLESDNLEVTLNPVYSSGTAVIKGSQPFQQNMHYYWEIKIISNLYGTDVMVGLGTDKIPSSSSRFCSLLGSDDQSWGYSYQGFIQHNKLTRQYGAGYGLGCLIGIHLDMCTGKLEYYLNRKPLGLAFDGLKNKELYPMACSTAAQSAMKLNCAVSNEETLQMLCLKCVQQHPRLFETYSSIPGLFNYYQRKYFWMVPREVVEEKSRTEEDDNLHLLAVKCSSSKTGGIKRTSDFLPKVIKKVSREEHAVFCCDSKETDSNIRKELDSDDVICKLVYDTLSDSDGNVSCDSDT